MNDLSPLAPEEREPISPQEARARIDAAIVERLGPDWNDEDEGWFVLHDGDYLVRLTKSSTNLDFQCDLLGQVSVEEKPATIVQTSGRLVAWMVLGFSLLLAWLLARLAGVLS